MSENKTIYNQQWFIVPPPWDRSGCLIYAGSEDPNIGEFVIDTENPTNLDSDPEDEQQLAEYLVNLHNAFIKECKQYSPSKEMLKAIEETRKL